MSRLLIVHGTGGPRRSDASVRLEWITSIQDGLMLAGHPVADLDVAVVNLDAAGRDWPPAEGADPRLLRRLWQNATFDSEPGPEPVGSDALAERLAWSRYFCGLTPAELTTTLGRAQVTPDIRAAFTPDIGIVIGHCLGGVAAAAALTEPLPTVHTLITLGSPHAATGGPSGGGTTWVAVTDVQDTLVLAAGAEPPGITEKVSLDCDPRLRGARNYLASPEFGKVLGSVLEVGRSA
ncbi:GPI inositol-deacylase [Actinoplanes bogorensis]|uniref:GPI inositol-deacylase n=1 Tax=Paractinoplanes bogorensis TaxID=1610840 RepID=A0ABS5YV02_9ACTN|nr:GPI inositol-deacylase [Actinoplanes bogorensis]MBU2665910.1 GPI inositol-deacylase [Actinoplanes bogorensis]